MKRERSMADDRLKGCVSQVILVMINTNQFIKTERK